MRTVNLTALKDKLVGVPGISGLTQTNIGGRMVFGFNGLTVGIDPSRTDDEIVSTLIEAADAKQAGAVVASDSIAASLATPMPAPQPATPKAKPMSTPVKGGFAAGLKAMMDEARAGIAQAQADGLSKVSEAVGKLNEAKIATVNVTGQIVKTVEDEAASVMAELGQISNSLGGENG